jgi:hypothetical protein
MRFFLIAMALSLVSLSADAKPRKRAHHAKAPAQAHKAPAPTHLKPDDRPAREHARAEAELADLRAGRIGDNTQQPAEPAQTWAVQENDREVPPNLKK